MPRRHVGMFVDTADLRARCEAITEVIDALVDTPRKKSNRDLVRKRVLRLFTEVDNLDMYTKCLKAPLDYLHSTFYRVARPQRKRGNQAPNNALQRTHSRVPSRAGRAHGPRHAARR